MRVRVLHLKGRGMSVHTANIMRKRAITHREIASMSISLTHNIILHEIIITVDVKMNNMQAMILHIDRNKNKANYKIMFT